MLSAETRIVSKRKLLFDKQYVAQYIQTYFVLEFCFLRDFQTKLFDFKKPQHYFVYSLQSCLNMYKNAKMREHFFYFLPKFTKLVASFLFALQAGFVFVVYDLVKRVT